MPVASALAVHDAARTRFNAMTLPNTVGGDVDATNTQFDNLPFTQPKDPNYWLRWHVRISDSQVVEQGNTKTWRHVGIAVASIFAPLEKGDKAALTDADLIKNNFRRVTADGVHWGDPVVRTRGRIEQGASTFWQIDVVCPFRAFEQG